MPTFSQTSLDRLATCDARVQEVLHEAIKHVDFVVLCGHRGQADQEQAFHDGRSTKHWPDSNHNQTPSPAVDIAPFPIDWSNIERFRFVAGFILGVAAAKGIQMRSGVDWNRNFDPKDEHFVDGPHLELV